MLEMWERIAAQKESEWARVWSDIGSATREVVYWRDVAPYKHLVKFARLKEGQSVCFGALDCLERPTEKCVNGHDTCYRHAKDCFACTAEKSTEAKGS